MTALAMVAQATKSLRMAKNVHYRAKDFTAKICVGYLVSRIYATNRAQLEAEFEGEDINFTQWRVLMCLRDEIANTAADISRELDHDKGSMTRILDQLEKRGFIQRQRDRDDRRLVFLTLTTAGRAAVNRLVPKLVNFYNDLLEDFSPQDVQLLTQLLTRLRAALKAGDTVSATREGARVG
jgi:DNA-binding MarR family transcriptional regulator